MSICHDLWSPFQVRSTTPTFCVATAESCLKSRHSFTTCASPSPNLSGNFSIHDSEVGLRAPGEACHLSLAVGFGEKLFIFLVQKITLSEEKQDRYWLLGCR